MRYEVSRSAGSDVDGVGAREQRLAALDVFLAEYEAAHGEITAAEMEAVVRRFGSGRADPRTP